MRRERRRLVGRKSQQEVPTLTPLMMKVQAGRDQLSH